MPLRDPSPMSPGAGRSRPVKSTSVPEVATVAEADRLTSGRTSRRMSADGRAGRRRRPTGTPTRSEAPRPGPRPELEAPVAAREHAAHQQPAVPAGLDLGADDRPTVAIEQAPGDDHDPAAAETTDEGRAAAGSQRAGPRHPERQMRVAEACERDRPRSCPLPLPARRTVAERSPTLPAASATRGAAAGRHRGAPRHPPASSRTRRPRPRSRSSATTPRSSTARSPSRLRRAGRRRPRRSTAARSPWARSSRSRMTGAVSRPSPRPAARRRGGPRTARRCARRRAWGAGRRPRPASPTLAIRRPGARGWSAPGPMARPRRRRPPS